MNSLIIAGGHIDLPFAEKVLKSQAWDLVICADAGLHFCLETGVTPDLVLGDFDSAKSPDLEAFCARWPERIETFPAEKDETDTELALDAAIRAGADEVTILGATGTRLDHVLGNVQLLARALDAGVACFLLDPHNRVRMVTDGLTLQRREQFGHYVSLLPFTSSVEGLTLRGFAYEVEDFTLRSGTSRGISNEIRGEEGVISFTDGILLVIESRD